MPDSKDFSKDILENISDTKIIGQKILFFDKVTSTFDKAKVIEPEDGMVIIAKEQTQI